MRTYLWKIEVPENNVMYFFSATKVIHVTSDLNASRKSIRQVFTSKSRHSRLTTTSFVESEARTFPFTFELGSSRKPAEILPTTINLSDPKSAAVEVSYQVTATWEPLKLTQQSSSYAYGTVTLHGLTFGHRLTIPIIVQADPAVHLVNGSQSSWIEIPLKSHRPVPVRCAVSVSEV
jgi:hypothetical protein